MDNCGIAIADLAARPEGDQARDAVRETRVEDPARIPARGWKQILVRVYHGFDENRILANAAGVTFFALLALFPGIAALVSIYGLFADPASIAAQLSLLSDILPGGAITVIEDQLNRVVAQGGGPLGLSFLVGIIASLWSANGGIKGLFDALNVIYGEQEKRSFLRFTAVTLAFTAAMIVFLIIAIVSIVALPAVLNYLPEFVAVVLDIGRWPVLAVLVALALSLIYRYGPSHSDARWQWISWGSAVAAVLWLAVSALFSYYAANFGTFNKTYGSLGAVVGFMLWIWLSVTVILLGGKLNAVIEIAPEPAVRNCRVGA